MSGKMHDPQHPSRHTKKISGFLGLLFAALTAYEVHRNALEIVQAFSAMEGFLVCELAGMNVLPVCAGPKPNN